MWMSRDWASDERTPDPERSVSRASCFIDLTGPSSSEVAAEVAAVVVLLPALLDLEETDSPLAAALAACESSVGSATSSSGGESGVQADSKKGGGKGREGTTDLLGEPLSLGSGDGSHGGTWVVVCLAREATKSELSQTRPPLSSLAFKKRAWFGCNFIVLLGSAPASLTLQLSPHPLILLSARHDSYSPTSRPATPPARHLHLSRRQRYPCDGVAVWLFLRAAPASACSFGQQGARTTTGKFLIHRPFPASPFSLRQRRLWARAASLRT
jgi:hypothetical protein